MHFCPILIAIMVALFPAQTSQKLAEDKDKMQGVWVFASSERDGKQELIDWKDILELEFSGDTFRFHLPAGAKHPQPFKLDQSVSPKTIDWLPGEKNRLTKPFIGIYELAGDDLKICWGKQDGPRPKEFTAKAGTERWLWDLKRQTKK
jgi:uncharacterized protein (TIGR03067 family)